VYVCVCVCVYPGKSKISKDVAKGNIVTLTGEYSDCSLKNLLIITSFDFFFWAQPRSH